MMILIRYMPLLAVSLGLILAFYVLYCWLFRVNIAGRIVGEEKSKTAEDLLNDANEVKSQVAERKSALDVAQSNIEAEKEALEDRFPEQDNTATTK